MQRLEDVVTPMQTSLNPEVLARCSYLVGNGGVVHELSRVSAKQPFSDEVGEFLNALSKELMANSLAKAYSDVITFAFWIRKSSLQKIKEKFARKEQGIIRLGKGVVFHIAPSNVPVNFAYSLVAGLLTGNANIVRVPSKGFAQVEMIAQAINTVLEQFPNMRPYIVLARYGHDQEINDLFSSIADMRVVWGGDRTIAEIRKSPLQPRAGEITFADRYSLAVIDSDTYMRIQDKARVAEDFYNDTFFSDQNACTSPRVVVWTGNCIDKAQKVFWKEEHDLVKRKYEFHAIQAVNKLTKSCLAAVAMPEAKVLPTEDNLIVRIEMAEISKTLVDYRENSGFFYEYKCSNITDLRVLCDNKQCQTVAYIGEDNALEPLLLSGIRGIDRVVPVGKTMDFDLIWDGYQLSEMLSRTIVVKQ